MRREGRSRKEAARERDEDPRVRGSEEGKDGVEKQDATESACGEHLRVAGHVSPLINRPLIDRRALRNAARISIIPSRYSSILVDTFLFFPIGRSPISLASLFLVRVFLFPLRLVSHDGDKGIRMDDSDGRRA